MYFKPSRRPHVLRALSAAATCLLLLGAAGLAMWNTNADAEQVPTASQAISSFFSGYVDADGRVVRHDQGDDTVSEGQSYALLLAVAADNPAAFSQIWRWTSGHLQKSDHLFAWHWSDGTVTDSQSASDADLGIAWALAVAGQKFANAAYTAEAKQVGNAVLDHETVKKGGQLVLVAGPWATSTSVVVDPSYFSPSAYAALWRLDYDPRWHALAKSSYDILRQLTASSPSSLPPDWARIRSTGKAVAAGGQTKSETSAPSSYGLDAARTEIWYGADCHADQRAVPQSAWQLLQPTADAGTFPIKLSRSGDPESSDTNALMPIADAAAAAAEGDSADAWRYLAHAADIDQDSPTYYGAAWLALGDVLLTTNDLGTCPPLKTPNDTAISVK